MKSLAYIILSIVRTEWHSDIKNINNFKHIKIKKKQWLNSRPKYILKKIHI